MGAGKLGICAIVSLLVRPIGTCEVWRCIDRGKTPLYTDAPTEAGNTVCFREREGRFTLSRYGTLSESAETVVEKQRPKPAKQKRTAKPKRAQARRKTSVPPM